MRKLDPVLSNGLGLPMRRNLANTSGVCRFLIIPSDRLYNMAAVSGFTTVWIISRVDQGCVVSCALGAMSPTKAHGHAQAGFSLDSFPQPNIGPFRIDLQLVIPSRIVTSGTRFLHSFQ